MSKGKCKLGKCKGHTGFQRAMGWSGRQGDGGKEDFNTDTW